MKLTLRIVVNMTWSCDDNKPVEEHLAEFSRQISEELLTSEGSPSDVEIEVTSEEAS